MKTKEKRSKNNIVFGAVVGLAGIACGLWLLISLEKLSGAEFVASSLGFAVIGLIITFAAEIQEFSIAGNSVKLKELRTEAERTIEELKQARTEVFRFLVQKSIEFSGGWATDSRVDERVIPFLKLFKQIEKFDSVNELEIDIKKALNVLMVGQYNQLKFIHETTKNVGDSFNEQDKPDILYIKLKDEMLYTMIKMRSPKPNFDDVKLDILKSMQAYSKLYAVKVKLDKLEKEL
ncbi:MAG: hypothetical protein WBQ67_08330 [Acinetobacter sp.]